MPRICFVIMGFGVKTDYPSGRSLDLDKTYHNIIKPAAEKAGYKCIRGDEVQDSGLIDKSMYALLIHSDLVIADISTLNPNAMYELGVRHASRPYSTIIMKEESSRFPFDINHNRIFSYKHLGADIGASEAKSCQERLTALIVQVTSKKSTDSPMYEIFKGLHLQNIDEDEFEMIIGDYAAQEKSLYALVTKAGTCKRKNDMQSAYRYWMKASELAPNEEYYIQQAAMCRYKSKEPTELMSLTDALNIISPIIENSIDPETLGITGAIYKNLYFVTKDKAYLIQAKELYGRGYQVRDDYYNGENYALCLSILKTLEEDLETSIYYKMEAKATRKRIVEAIKESLNMDPQADQSGSMWLYATLSNCYLGLGDEENHKLYEAMFNDQKSADWEQETYDNGIKLTKEYL